MTWGIKQSYRAYVTGMAAGTPADGATQAADNGAFTFTGGTGSYDSTTHAVKLGRGRDHHRGRDRQRHHTERRPARRRRRDP
ncbi:HtaA domain-containing protein [Streptomyces mirabilis]|uniref:HtaA domain-containing protein n=1 Tax=Streptomyces mirabilis TaxID=68239 RepID=UPI00352CE0D8